jgi:hypothetical protein
MTMDMNLVTVCVSPSVFASALVLSTTLYVVYILVRALGDVRRPAHGLWRSQAPMFLALIPLSSSGVLAWMGVARTSRGLSLVGVGSRGALSAGLAESLMTLVCGGITAGGMAALFLVICMIQARRNESGSNVRGSLGYPTLALNVCLAVAAWYCSGQLFQTALFDARVVRETHIGFAIAVLVALITIALAIRARRMRPEVPPWRAHALALTLLLAVCAAMVIGIWQSIAFYRFVAIHGITPLS